MTVKDLVAHLQTLPQEVPIVINGYEGGVGEFTVHAIRKVKIIRNVHHPDRKLSTASDWYNRREVLPQDKVVIISRYNLNDGVVRFENNDYNGLHEIVMDEQYKEVLWE